MAAPGIPERITVPLILNSKRIPGDHPRKLVAITAYDFTSARLFDPIVDILLVGDSVASIVQGLDTTLPVTLDEMIYHCRCVARGARKALLVGDLPFMSYQVSPERALEAAGRLMKEGGVAAVKLEGGLPMAGTIRRLVDIDIPVMGHVGLTPQSYHRMGGHKVQGRASGSIEDAGTRERVIEDALAVEKAGAFACVLESIPAELAAEITEQLTIPTIGIGAGAACDGQILVSADMLGLNPDFAPKFVKRYAELGRDIHEAVSRYAADVRDGSFPGPEHAFSAPAPEPRAKRRLKLASR